MYWRMKKYKPWVNIFCAIVMCKKEGLGAASHPGDEGGLRERGRRERRRRERGRRGEWN
jgi:hypothetical protein